MRTSSEALGDDFIDSVQLNIHRKARCRRESDRCWTQYDFAAHYTEPALLELE